MNEVAQKVKSAFENCLVQMRQASKMFENDPEWQEAIDEGEQALAELSKAMEQQYYTLKQLDAGMEIANISSMHGYRSTNGRDTRSQYLNWAVEFENSVYNPDDRMETIKKFAEQKMLMEIEAGRGRFREDKVTSWHVDNIRNEEKLEFDPTTPENYLQLMSDKSLQDKHQYDVNNAFEKHILGIGDSLAQQGWNGVTNFLISENPVSLNHESKLIGAYFKPIRIENSGNVIGGSWHVVQQDQKSKVWETIETIPDGLNRSKEFISDRIMMVKNKQLDNVSVQNAAKLVKTMGVPIEVADSQFNKTISGPIIGRTGMHVIQNAGKSVVIYETEKLNRVPEKNENVTISYQGGKGKVNDKALEKTNGVSR